MKGNYVPLESLMVRRGGSVDPSKFKDEEFDLYSIPAFDRGGSELVFGRDIGSSKQVLETGDVLLSKIVPHIRRAWVVGESRQRRIIGSGEWIVFRAAKSANPRYLSHVLVGDPFHSQFMQTVSGVGGSLLRARPAEVAKIQIPLPPLAEQKRIAAILDAADALRAKRREALAQLDALLQSTFLTLFGDPVTNPMGWPVAKSGTLFSDKPRIGTTQPANGEGTLVVRVGEVGASSIAFSKCGRVTISTKDYDKFRLEVGDTVIARAIGSRDQLGKASFFRGHSEAVVIDSHVMRLRPDSKTCDPLWFFTLLSSPRGKGLLQQKGGATAVQFNINAKQAVDLDIPLPPLPLQQKFAAIVESIERQKSTQRAHLAELDALFATLQHRAFRGEL